MEGLLSAMSGKKRSDRPTLPLSKTGKPDQNIVENPPRHPKSEQLKPGSEGRLPGTPRLIGRRESRLPQCPQSPSDCAAHRGRLDSPPPHRGVSCGSWPLLSLHHYPYTKGPPAFSASSGEDVAVELLTEAGVSSPAALFWTSLVQRPSQALEVFGPAFVGSGGHNKISQAGWLTQQIFIFS